MEPSNMPPPPAMTAEQYLRLCTIDAIKTSAQQEHEHDKWAFEASMKVIEAHMKTTELYGQMVA
jgi:hypothetical protein